MQQVFFNFFSLENLCIGLWKSTGGTNDAKCLAAEVSHNGEMQRFIYKYLSHYPSRKLVWFLDR